MTWDDANNQRRPLCKCGKVNFSKKDARTKKNWLEGKGKVRVLRIYPCPISNMWHITEDKGKRKYHEK